MDGYHIQWVCGHIFTLLLSSAFVVAPPPFNVYLHRSLSTSCAVLVFVSPIGPSWNPVPFLPVPFVSRFRALVMVSSVELLDFDSHFCFSHHQSLSHLLVSLLLRYIGVNTLRMRANESRTMERRIVQAQHRHWNGKAFKSQHQSVSIDSNRCSR